MNNSLEKNHLLFLYASILGTIIGAVSMYNNLVIILAGMIVFILLLIQILKVNFTNKIVIIIYISIFQPYLVIANKNIAISLLFIPLIFISDLYNKKIVIDFKNNKQLLFFIIYLVSIILSIYNCINISASVIWVLMWFCYFILYTWISLNKDNIDITRIYNALFNCGIIMGFIGIAQFIAFNFGGGFGKFSDELLNNSFYKLIYGNQSEIIGTTSGSWTKGGFVRATTLFPNPDSNGLFSLMIIVIVIIYLNERRSKKSILCFCVITINFLLSLSRASWASFLIIFIVLLLFYKGNRLKRFLQFAIVIIFSLVFLLLVNKLNMFLDIFYSIFNTTTDTSNLGRLIIWNQNLQMFKNHILIGGGIGNYNDIYMSFFNLNEANVKYSAHNAYLLVLVEQGLVGVISFVLFLIMPIKEVFSKSIKKIIGLNKQFILAVSLISIAIMVQYIFDYSLGEIRYMNLIFICFAVVYNIKRNEIKS